MGQLFSSIKELEAKGKYKELANAYLKVIWYYHNKGNTGYKIYLQKLKEAMTKRDAMKPQVAEHKEETMKEEKESEKGLEMKIIHV